MEPDVFPGRSYPLGATVYGNGVNFSVFSRNCSVLELLLFDKVEDIRPSRVILLDAQQNRTFYYWHVFVRGLQVGQLYAFRAHGPYAPERGLRYDGDKVLVDPYARAVAYTESYLRSAASRPGSNCEHALKSVVVDPRGYNWEGDTPLQNPFAGTLIYELHVGGFTRSPSSGVEENLRGTYAGLVQKIPYLKELGVTAVELLPVQQFDEQEAPPGLSNYWGYGPINFFSPHRGYSSRKDPLGPVEEFKDMVKAMHRSGIEVILDVVFNHTAEGDHTGPVLSLRGLENRTYYLLDPQRPAYYANYTGVGNTLNANNSIVRRLVIDSLHYWVQVMHVDGFRFDLASVLSRDESGVPSNNPPLLWEIESDPILAGTKIIAEAWDAAGLYQVGSFVGHRWAEWNGQYRDDVRRFIKGETDTVSRLAQRIAGSRDLYAQPDREPNRSINFITCHDGFTLNDLVSYDQKHNEANRLANTDGTDLNYSWNCGVEGPTHSAHIEKLRLQQIKNFLVVLFTSQGTPMLLMGDEARRTQAGNNNTFCQDNPLSWFDWKDVERNADLYRFTRKLVQFYKEHALFQQEKFWLDSGGAEVTWHGVQLNQPDWSGDSHSLAYELTNVLKGEHLLVLLNAYWEPLVFELPKLAGKQRWQRVVDTARNAPDDFSDPSQALNNGDKTAVVQSRSAIILTAK
jgi:isoamylase